MQYGLLAMLPRSTSCNDNKIIVPYTSSSVHVSDSNPTHKSIFQRTRFRISTLFRSILTSFIPLPNTLLPTRLSLPSPSLSRTIIGTLFGHRHGHVSFAVQPDPRSDPVLIVQLAVTTANLVREMSTGLVRIALETDKGGQQHGRQHAAPKLFEERKWSMFCNGRKCGYALSRSCGESDWHVLSTVRSVSVGAGVIPLVGDGRRESETEGELMYMRAKFERVVGSRDSEAFYMMNPDGNGGPELSIFLLRI